MWLRRKKNPRGIELYVMSRANAVEYCRGRHREPSVIISISDPSLEYDEAPFRTEENRVEAILPLCFSDAEEPGKDVYGLDVEEEDLMRDEDAQKVARFVLDNRDKRIIVHCDAGISRSAGVGAAIVNYFTGDAGRFFESGEYEPNMWCFSKVMTALIEA
ncbi:MAG: dual specificity protein phosphatase family protein [Oscillospiraceae bacterium]|nr:dual specificity protein phosphatase family protein [Oscillospiraceae bacterium]